MNLRWRWVNEHDELHIWATPGYPDKCVCMCALCALPPRPSYNVTVWCICPDCTCAAPPGKPHRKSSVNTLKRYARASQN